MIKLMYGNTKENALNTTLFLRNVSDISYVCLDAGENFYVYLMYRFKQFGYDWTNVILGGLQNALSKIMFINTISDRINTANE
jgi:hypothetical protein